MKSFYFVSLLSLVLFSCSSSEESTNNQEEPKVAKIVTQTDTGSEEFLYTYSGNKLVVSSMVDGPYYRYNYSGNRLVSSNLFNLNEDVPSGSTDYEYNASGKLIQEVQYNSIEGTARRITYSHDTNEVNFTIYEGNVFDQNEEVGNGKHLLNQEGEIIETQEYVGQQLVYRSTYTYDTFNNPFKNAVGLEATSFQIGKKRNVLQIQNYNEENTLVDTFSYEYQYNTDGYPISSTTTLNDQYYSNSLYYYE